MKKENSLIINIAEGKPKIGELLPGFAAVFAAAIGFAAMFGEAFALEISPVVFGIFGVLAAFCLLLSYKKQSGSIALICSAAVFAAVLIIPQAKGGMILLANRIMEFLTAATGRIYLPFESGENGSPELAFILVFTALSVLIGFGANRKYAMFILPAVFLSTAGLLFGFLSTDIHFAVFAVGILLILLCAFGPKNRAKATAKKFFAVFAPAAICVLFCIVLVIFAPAEAGIKIKQTAEEYAHGILYDGKTNAMPEGELKNLGFFEKNDAPALEITMEKPQKLYLKGFVGEVYTGSGWEETESEVLAEYAEDFYILHENGFFGQKAVASALLATGEAEESLLSIKNISACSKRAYLPYAVSGAVLNGSAIGDVNTESFGKEYSVGYVPGGLSEWYKAQVELSEKQDKVSAVDEHLANEYIYREFVKANYLSVPEDAFNAVDRIFEDSEASTATEIITAILLYLEENVEYDETVAARNGEEDFAAYFLEKTARGYSVHYATAATLMLRYFGIPARYVEGYFLPAEEAAEYQSGDTITLTENHAHAWAEYYLEGVGWVPFEVTPGYIDDELEKAAFRTSGESAKRYEQSELPETNVEQDRPKDDITEAERNYTALIIAVSAALAAVLAALLVWAIVMRKRLKKALAAISEADNKNGAAMRFGYAQKLSESAALSVEILETCGYSEVFEINREALFSEHEITDEQRKTVDDYAEKILAECKKEWNFWQKLKNKWIKFIY